MMKMPTTEFILVKQNMLTRTKDLKVVKHLINNGWKIKISNFGELI